DREGYNLLKESDFERLACKYNATNIIIEKPKKLDLKLVYESEYFRIYEINNECARALKSTQVE
ncbi:MAG: hypothetical protein NWF08_06625, partial [Candidatus Bathyarchaeota archaeon]|nr:hypothetical protein [Candidatus Bathyarchaeota archaeon]